MWTLEDDISIFPFDALIKLEVPWPKNTDGDWILTSLPLIFTFEDVICKYEVTPPINFIPACPSPTWNNVLLLLNY